MLEQVDKFVRDTYGLDCDLVSTQVEDGIVYFISNLPFLKARVFPDRIMIEELFPKNGLGLLVVNKKVKR